MRFKKSLYANIFGWLCCAALLVCVLYSASRSSVSGRLLTWLAPFACGQGLVGDLALVHLASRVDCGLCLCLAVYASYGVTEVSHLVSLVPQSFPCRLWSVPLSRCLPGCTLCTCARKRARTHRRRTISTISCRRRPRDHCCHWGRTTDLCRQWARSRWSWSQVFCFRPLSEASSACSPAPAVCPSSSRKNKNPPRSRARGPRDGTRRRAGAAVLVRGREERRCRGEGL